MHAAAQDAHTVRLDPAMTPVEVVDSAGWFGPSTEAGIASASRGALPFSFAVDRRLPFDGQQSLWLKLRVQRIPGSTEVWFLQVPVAIVDRVTLYQREPGGSWAGTSAGDRVALREWPLQVRYPTFPLRLEDRVPTDLFLEVRHSSDLRVPLRLVTAAAHAERSQLEHLALGVLMGVLGLLLVSAAWRGVLLRDGVHAWYATFTALAMLSIASFTGVAGQVLWGDAPGWPDAAPGCLTLLASGVAAWLFHRLALPATQGGWLGAALRALAFAGPFLAFLYLLVDRSVGVLMLGLQPLLVGVAALCAAILTSRRGDPVGKWLLLGSLPLCLSVVVAMLRVTGLLAPSWWSEYLLVLALTLNLPMLLVALNSRTEVRRSVELRRIASASQDPLTGLMKRTGFLARVHQAVVRHQLNGESAGLAVVQLKNLEWIRSQAGEEAANEALLRTVIQLRRSVRDADTTGRLSENTFGLIVEGATVRDGMARIASRLIAAGLMQDPQSPPEPQLQLHIAAVMLNQHTAPAETLIGHLHGVLAEMSERTRRPFRFYEPRQALASDPPPVVSSDVGPP